MAGDGDQQHADERDSHRTWIDAGQRGDEQAKDQGGGQTSEYVVAAGEVGDLVPQHETQRLRVLFGVLRDHDPCSPAQSVAAVLDDPGLDTYLELT